MIEAKKKELEKRWKELGLPPRSQTPDQTAVPDKNT
jgi:hypothetical protein